MPVTGAAISAGAATTTTDNNGEFTFINISLDKNAAFIKVEKNGFFTSGRMFMATAGGKHFVSIKLIKKNLAGSFNAASGGQVVVPDNGGQISFAANSIVVAAGNTAYTGTVMVNAYFINPVLDDYSNEMPGALRGIRTNQQQAALLPVGMLAVELLGSGGEKLQLANGTPATVTMPIADMSSAVAPATIPVWSFNDTSRFWKQEGVATKQGQNYVFQATHFSYWTSAVDRNPVTYKAILKKAGAPLARVKVLFIPDGKEGIYSQAYTDSTGALVCKLPAAEIMSMYAISPCGRKWGVLASLAFAEDYDQGVVEAGAYSGADQVVFSGTVVDCNGAAVTNGYVNINLGGHNFSADIVSGTFSAVVDKCDDGGSIAELKAFDGAGQAGFAKQVTVSGSTVDAGELTTCTTPAGEFLTYILAGVKYSYNAPNDVFSASRSIYYNYEYDVDDTITAISGFRSNDTYDGALIRFKGTTSISKLMESEIYNKDPSGIANTYNIDTVTGPRDVHITEYGPVGGYVAGSFNAKTTSSQTVNFTFRVKRIQ